MPSPEPASVVVDASHGNMARQTLSPAEHIENSDTASDGISPLLSCDDDHERSPSPETLLPSLAGRFRSFQAARSVTAPPQLTLPVSPPSKSPGNPAAEQPLAATASRGSTSPTESSDSFHSVQSWHSPIAPPSPPVSDPGSPTAFPYPHDNIPKPQISHHREVSDATITPVDNGTWMLSPTSADVLSRESSSDTSSVYEDAGLASTDPSVEEPISAVAADDIPSCALAKTTAIGPRPRIRHRSTASGISVATHRALSPLPPAANLFTPHRQFPQYNSSKRASTRLEAVQRLPGAIIHKTCEIIMAPPRELLALMLKVAARLAAGEWRGLVFGTGTGGESISVHWDYSDDDGASWPSPAAHASGGTRNSSPGSSARDGKTGTIGSADEQRSEDSDPDWSRSWEVD